MFAYACMLTQLMYKYIYYDTTQATSWSSSTFLPLQWHEDEWSQRVDFIGGLNKCGNYCTAWGCGVNQTDYWTQEQCEPNTGGSIRKD